MIRSAPILSLMLLVLTAAVGCAPPSQARDARTSYNAGLGLTSSGKFKEGIELLSKARANATGDIEVRFRAAFALGESYARWAETIEQGEEQLAIDRLERAEAWFRDAIRIRENDEKARQNLALAIARRRELIDKMTAGGRTLEARLDAALTDQRGVRDELRAAEASLAAGAVTASVLAPAMDALATRERRISADVGVVSDLAADERGEIEAIGEDERTAEQKGRLAQLAALVYYLESARNSIGDARRAARREGAERAVRRAESAVGELVRAREQLLDPAQVIAGLAREENQMFQQTRVLAALASGDITLEDGAKREPPPHLTSERLAERQRHVHERAAELDARLAAYVAYKPSGDDPQEQAAAQAQAQAVLAKAAPFVSAAVAAMDTAASALGRDDIASAAPAMSEALTNLARALEYFAGLRQLIELTHADQSKAVTLLDPSSGDDALGTEERTRQISMVQTLNGERLERMVSLLATEKKTTLEQLAQQGGDPDAEQTQAIEAKFAAAETHRAAAAAAVTAMAAAFANNGDVATPAKTAQAELEELRRIFFSLIEHLKDLHRRQGTTRDGVSTADGAPDEERPALLGPLTESQAEHAALGAQIGEALAAQADQAASAGQPPQPGAPDAEALAAAADEVRQATTLMEAAARKLSEATSNAQSMSVDLEPPLEDQKSAIEHLAAAIALLEPPKQDEQQKQDQQQQQDQQDQQDQQQQDQQQDQQQQQDQDLSQNEIERRLRALRENEANRRRERENQPRTGTVERDW